MLEKLKQEINLSLKNFFSKVKKEYKLHIINSSLFKALEEYCLREGKRIRPILLSLSYFGYSPENKRNNSIFDASISIELLHNFMLIHDDIIDSAALRRGKPTLHKVLERTISSQEQEKIGCNLGIIAGDILYALAVDAFLAMEAPADLKVKALKYFTRTSAFTAAGEYIDTLQGLQKLSETKETEIFLNYTLKTAKYTFDCPLVIGAILGRAKDSELKKLSTLATLIGHAFQIQDDIIGIFGTEETIGKSVLSDLDEFKKTLLVYHAYNNLQSKNKARFISIFNKEKKNYQDLEEVKRLFIKSGTLFYCLKTVSQKIDKALDIFSGLEMKEDYRETIKTALLSFFKQSNEIAIQYKINIQVKTK